MKAKAAVFQNGRVITPEGVLEGVSLLSQNGVIRDIGSELGTTDRKVVDLKGRYLAPGLTELHIHGCGTWGFENIDLDGFKAAASFLMENGITTVLPTFQWDRRSVENIAAIVHAYKKEGGRIKIPGIYIEGPFINPIKKGGISTNSIEPPSLPVLEEVLEAGDGLIRIMTIAPELKGIEKVMDVLINNQIIPSFGHSNASIQETETLNAICSRKKIMPGMTHLFNASSPISHKEPGLAMLPFLGETFYELNADGIHIEESMLRFISRVGVENKMILISDALISAGLLPIEVENSDTKNASAPAERSLAMAPAPYFYYDKEVLPSDRGVRLIEGDILAGSSLLIPEIIHNYCRVTGAPLHKGIRAASATAFEFLGLSGGKIAPGEKTSLAIFDERLNLQEMFI
ncbi:MAG: amidohydrolase family protein [Spirochaetales bacterium]|nr:amidohydrolase family protein [Spirochaetales bacterium]